MVYAGARFAGLAHFVGVTNGASGMACVVPTWALGLRAGNLYFEGIINGDLLESTLELHKRDTVSTFGTRSSRRTGKLVEISNVPVGTLERREGDNSKEKGEKEINVSELAK